MNEARIHRTDGKEQSNKRHTKRKQVSFSCKGDDGTFMANSYQFAATIYGHPRPYKRPGYGVANGRRYNPNNADQVGFIKALETLYKQDTATSYFGSVEVQITVLFYVSKKKNADIDNLLKFLLDALQKARLYDNDIQISKVLAERRSVQDEDLARTYFIVEKRIIEID